MISILIATYGEPHWEQMAKERALPSAMGQDAQEVLIGHDSEGTIASARNGLADEATGEWLCFLDADDELAPGFIDAMQSAVHREREYSRDPLLLTPAVSQIRGRRPGKPFFFPGDEKTFKTGNWLIIGTLVQKSLFLEVGGFSDHPHGLEDWVIWAKCVKAGARIVKVPKAVYIAYYNRNSKHHELARDRPAYSAAYERARAEVWG